MRTSHLKTLCSNDGSQCSGRFLFLNEHPIDLFLRKSLDLDHELSLSLSSSLSLSVVVSSSSLLSLFLFPFLFCFSLSTLSHSSPLTGPFSHVQFFHQSRLENATYDVAGSSHLNLLQGSRRNCAVHRIILMSAHGRGWSTLSRRPSASGRLQETCGQERRGFRPSTSCATRRNPDGSHCADGEAASLAGVGGHSPEEILQVNSPSMAHRWSAHLSKYGRGARTTDAEMKNKRDMAPDRRRDRSEGNPAFCAAEKIQ